MHILTVVLLSLPVINIFQYFLSERRSKHAVPPLVRVVPARGRGAGPGVGRAETQRRVRIQVRTILATGQANGQQGRRSSLCHAQSQRGRHRQRGGGATEDIRQKSGPFGAEMRRG